MQPIAPPLPEEYVNLIAISVQDLLGLIVRLRSTQPPDPNFRWNWSIWRHRHQAEANAPFIGGERVSYNSGTKGLKAFSVWGGPY